MRQVRRFVGDDPSAHPFGAIRLQRACDLCDRLVRKIAERCTAGADGIAVQIRSLLCNGVGVAELEAGTDVRDAVLRFLSARDIARQEAAVDGDHI